MRARPFAAALLLATVLAGCSSAHRAPEAAATTPAPSTTSAPPTVPASTTPPTTAPYSPTIPQGSPDGAATRLVSDWSTGDPAAASADASPAAVSTLFSIAYPAGDLQARGCTDPSTDPGTCTYRDTANDTLYQLTVDRGPSGWYVSAVTPES